LGSKWGCVNLKGNEVVTPQYEKIEINQFDNPRIAAKLNGKWGFINDNGKEVTAFKYDKVTQFHNCRARVKKNDKYGFINTKGVEVIPLIYDACESRFNDEYIDYFSYEKDILPIWIYRCDKFGFVDISGKEKIKPMYDNMVSFACIGKGKVLAAVEMNDAAGFIDETGKIVIPLMYEPDFGNSDNYNFSDGYANVKLKGKWGVIDVQNNVVLPFIYDEFLKNQGAGFRYALRNGKKISIDRKGNEWEMKKNLSARTFKDYLHAVEWSEVAESLRRLGCLNENDIEKDLNFYERYFNVFRKKRFKPSKDIIRIFAAEGLRNSEGKVLDARMFSVKDDCACCWAYYLAPILDMEVRIEDNLTLTDADVVAVSIWATF